MTHSIVKRTAFAAAAALSLTIVAMPSAAAADIAAPANVASQSFGQSSQSASANVLGDMTFEKGKKRKYRKRYKRNKHYANHGHYQRGYDRHAYRDMRVWRGRDGRAYCRRDDGTTGLLIGAGVGALLGNELAGRGDRTLGAILGAAGGALLGREIDRNDVRCR